MAETLNLPIGEGTRKKLRALAMLEGSNLGSIEERLAGYLDEIITARCAELLGIETQTTTAPISYTLTFPEQPEAKTKLTDEVEEPVQSDEVSGHELSGDEDMGETKSLQEQLEDEEDPAIARLAQERPMRKVIDDEEAFLDASLGKPRQDADDGFQTTSRVSASKSFQSRLRKGGGAKVAPYTGDEA